MNFGLQRDDNIRSRGLKGVPMKDQDWPFEPQRRGLLCVTPSVPRTGLPEREKQLWHERKTFVARSSLIGQRTYCGISIIPKNNRHPKILGRRVGSSKEKNIRGVLNRSPFLGAAEPPKVN